MKKVCLSNLPYLLLAMLMMAMTGCGASNSAVKADSAAPGAAKVSLAYPAAKTTASIAQPSSLQFTVTGTGINNGPIPVVKATSSDTTGGTVNGIYPGTVTVAVKAVDSTGNVLYEGYALNVVVPAGATTNVGTITMAVPTIKAEEAPCLKCHETSLDATGQNIVGAYKNSGHYTNVAFTDANGQEPGCVGCHGPSHNIQNPSADGSGSNASAPAGTNVRCFDCHNLANTNTTLVQNHSTYYLANGTGCSACHQMHNSKAGNMERKSWAQSAHGSTDFANLTGGASFNNCANRCHNAKNYIAAVNNPTVPVSGNIAAQSPQMITCDACHTNAPLGVLRTLAGTKPGVFATYTTSGKGYQFAPYNYVNGSTVNGVTYGSKKPYYPDVAGSNLCIVCHSGTLEGSSTTARISDPYYVNSAAAQSIKSGGTIGQHNMPAAAVMYVKFGFMNLSTGSNGQPTPAYLASLTSDIDGGTISSTHRKFGTSAIVTDSHFSASHPAPANLQVNGPCAVCHVSGSHSYKIDQAAVNAVCSNCHSSENGNDLSNISSFRQYFVEPNKEVYRNALLLGATIINSRVAAYNATLTSTPNALGYSSSNPLQFVAAIDPMESAQPGKFVFLKYFLYNTDGSVKLADDGTYYVSSSSSSSSIYAAPGTANANYLAPAATTAPYYSSDWTNAAIALGYSQVAGDQGYTKFVGAISNLMFFAKDNGGFAHARTYSRRLIYDSLDFLDDASLDMSVSKTALSLSGQTGSAVAGLYTKGSKAYNMSGSTLTAPASGTSESMLYLIGWSRSTGAWSTPERP